MKKVFVVLLSLFMMQNVNSANEEQSYTVALQNGSTLNIQVCADDIFRVRISPRKTFNESLLERYNVLKKDWKSIDVNKKENAKEFSLSTPKYTVVVDKADNSLLVKDAKGGKVIERIWMRGGDDPVCTSLGEIINKKYLDLKVANNSGIIGDDKNPITVRDQVETGEYSKNSVLSLSLKDDERFYGGGSTSRDHIQHRGELLRMWTTYAHTEIPHPFMLSSNNWGIFNNTTRKNFFDVGYSEPANLNVYNTSDEADFYLMFGNSMADVITRYVTVTGKPFLLPKWAYGLNFGPHMSEDQFDILNDAVRFRERNFPCDMMWLEPQWMEKRYDFSTEKKWNFQKFSPEPYWNANKFPKKEAHNLFIGKMHDLGYKMALWLCIEYDQSVVAEDELALAAGKDTSGQEHWMNHLMNFVDGGIDGFKIDPARTIDEHPDFKYYNGRSDKEMHNLNQVLMPKQFNTTYRTHKNKRPFVHYTAGWAGTQHWAASTSGDNGGGRTALFDQLNLGMSGALNTSCDIMSVEASQVMSSLHFGVFLPWMQINSWYSLHHPFYMSKKKEQIYTDYIKLRYALQPYIYSAALEGSQTGMPIVRSMPMTFPDDRNTDDMVFQYMFGQNFLVGIFSDSIYLPKGNWIDYWTNETLKGGTTIQHSIPENRAGLLFVREGSIIPQQYEMQFNGEKALDSLILKIYPGDYCSYILREDDGVSYEYENRKVATTKYECKRDKSKMEIIINPTEGDYDGLYKSRTYEMDILMNTNPKEILIDGKVINDWKYENGKVKFYVTQSDVRTKLSVMIK